MSVIQEIAAIDREIMRLKAEKAELAEGRGAPHEEDRGEWFRWGDGI